MESAVDFCLSMEECYETIIQTMAEGVFVVNQDGIIVFANDAMERLTGYQSDELIGKRCHTFMQCQCHSGNCALSSAKELARKECNIRRKDGQLVPVFRNARLKKNQLQQVLGIIETVTDISELKAVKQKVELLEKKEQDRTRFRNMIGKSQPMKQVFSLIEMAASSNASILIAGETGTGKELIAELIHQQSLRKKKPLVKVNCSALSENLLESELFGHVKGAFTGATNDKIGRFELADKGTLFLDEISEISPLIQLKILRFLQEKEFERVGENRTRKSDVRIISATNKELIKLIAEGAFREDLYYRLKVFPIKLPPLRERKEDLALLIDHFIAKFNTETGKSLTGVSQQAAAALLNFDYFGNVRELENAIEHAFVIRKSGEIQLEDLPYEIRIYQHSPIESPRRNRQSASEMSETSIESSQTKTTVTADRLLQLLDQYQWNKTAVAGHLNVNRTTVWRMMKKFKLQETS